MDAGLMSAMSDEHLLRAIECGPMTDSERELVARCGRLLDEQSDFRAQLIEEVLEICDQPGTKKELIAAIKRSFENSYVEI